MPEVNLNVILLRNTTNPEETIAMAAKLCYSPSDITELKKKIESKNQKTFIEKLVKIGHMTPIEHASFTFAIEGISRACSHQLVRHRLASYSQQSQRYVSESSQSATRGQSSTQDQTAFDYIVPPSIAQDQESRKFFVKFMCELQRTYDFLVERLNKNGIKGEAANQDARFVLPNAAETKIIVTMNARELLHFFRLRCCYRAQWEIRNLAQQMLFLAKKAAPIIFEKAGPACLYAPCPEGDLNCGQAKRVRKIYGSLYRERKRKRIKESKVLTHQKGLFQE
ncbi:MAG: FAD-dependent thymidylate synthase [Nitrospirota bacterium]|nr:FAD-dependent thymidylate synthase [Nitrospirota bacterium]